MRNTFEIGSTAAIASRNSVRFVQVTKKDGRGCVTVWNPETGETTQWNARTGKEWGTGSRRYSICGTHLISEADANLRIANNEQRKRVEDTVQEVNNLLGSINRMGVYWSPEEGRLNATRVLESLGVVADKLSEIVTRNTF